MIVFFGLLATVAIIFYCWICVLVVKIIYKGNQALDKYLK